MSLQIAAKHLAAKGRGPDTTLVHMTNKEVQGLQALAEKNGGSLSINPETGLPEAGFLESILPVVAGVGLTAAGMGPMAAALTVGGVSALSTGSLSKGLFAGLGAYGGASLGEQLAVQGMSEAAAANASFGDKLAGMGDASAFSSFENAGKFISANKLPAMAGIAGPLLSSMEDERENDKPAEPVKDTDPGARARSGIKYNPGWVTPTPLPNPYGIEQTYNQPYYGAEGGSAHMAEGGMAYGGSTSGPIDTKTQFADYLTRVMNPTNRANAVSGNPYSWWKSPGAPAAPVTPPAETPEEYAARTRTSTGGGGRGEREPEDPNSFSAQWAAMSDAEKEAFRLENPKIAAAQDLAMLIGSPFMFAYNKLQEFMGPDSSTGGPARYARTPVVPNENDEPGDRYAPTYSPTLSPSSLDPAQQAQTQDAVAQTNAALTGSPVIPMPYSVGDEADSMFAAPENNQNYIQGLAMQQAIAANPFSPQDANKALRNAYYQSYPRVGTTPEAQQAAIDSLTSDSFYAAKPDDTPESLQQADNALSARLLAAYPADVANAQAADFQMSAPTKAKMAAYYAAIDKEAEAKQNAALSADFNRIAETPALREQYNRLNLGFQTDEANNAEPGDRYAPVSSIYQTPATETSDVDSGGYAESARNAGVSVPDTISALYNPFTKDYQPQYAANYPNLPGEISAETATAPKVVDLKTEETPVEQALVDLAPLIAGLPDVSTSTSFTTPARGLAAIGGMYGGLGSVWRGADGLPVVGGDGKAILTSQGAAENAYNASPEGIAAANDAETKSLQNRYQNQTPTINSSLLGTTVPTNDQDAGEGEAANFQSLMNAMLNPPAPTPFNIRDAFASVDNGVTSDAGEDGGESDGGNYSNEGRNAPAPSAPSDGGNYSNEGRNAPAPSAPSSGESNPGDPGRGGGGANVPSPPMGANASPSDGSAPPSGDRGGGGGGGGGRVICTHFYRKGEMSRDMWRSDLEFTFKNLSPTTVRGYQYWAIPYVKLMRKSKLAENIMRPLAMHRAKELSYQMGRSAKGSLFGKVVRLIGEPICFTVGLFVGEQNWQSLWNPAKD